METADATFGESNGSSWLWLEPCGWCRAPTCADLRPLALHLHLLTLRCSFTAPSSLPPPRCFTPLIGFLPRMRPSTGNAGSRPSHATRVCVRVTFPRQPLIAGLKEIFGLLEGGARQHVNSLVQSSKCAALRHHIQLQHEHLKTPG